MWREYLSEVKDLFGSWIIFISKYNHVLLEVNPLELEYISPCQTKTLHLLSISIITICNFVYTCNDDSISVHHQFSLELLKDCMVKIGDDDWGNTINHSIISKIIQMGDLISFGFAQRMMMI